MSQSKNSKGTQAAAVEAEYAAAPFDAPLGRDRGAIQTANILVKLNSSAANLKNLYQDGRAIWSFDQHSGAAVRGIFGAEDAKIVVVDARVTKGSSNFPFAMGFRIEGMNGNRNVFDRLGNAFDFFMLPNSDNVSETIILSRNKYLDSSTLDNYPDCRLDAIRQYQCKVTGDYGAAADEVNITLPHPVIEFADANGSEIIEKNREQLKLPVMKLHKRNWDKLCSDLEDHIVSTMRVVSARDLKFSFQRPEGRSWTDDEELKDGVAPTEATCILGTTCTAWLQVQIRYRTV